MKLFVPLVDPYKWYNNDDMMLSWPVCDGLVAEVEEAETATWALDGNTPSQEAMPLILENVYLDLLILKAPSLCVGSLAPCGSE